MRCIVFNLISLIIILVYIAFIDYVCVHIDDLHTHDLVTMKRDGGGDGGGEKRRRRKKLFFI